MVLYPLQLANQVYMVKHMTKRPNIREQHAFKLVHLHVWKYIFSSKSLPRCLARYLCASFSNSSADNMPLSPKP